MSEITPEMIEIAYTFVGAYVWFYYLFAFDDTCFPNTFLIRSFITGILWPITLPIMLFGRVRHPDFVVQISWVLANKRRLNPLTWFWLSYQPVYTATDSDNNIAYFQYHPFKGVCNVTETYYQFLGSMHYEHSEVNITLEEAIRAKLEN